MNQIIKFKLDTEVGSSTQGHLLVSYDNGCTWEDLGLVAGNGTNGQDGADGTNGTNGTDGRDGTDGLTPFINENTGTWWIGTTDTGVVAEGTNGEITIESSSDIGVAGSPSVSTRTEGNKLFIKFHELKGAQGPQGPKGDAGPQGNPGPQGAGLNFKETLEDCTAVNDAFIDTDANLYVCVEAGETPIEYANLKGPQGDGGDKGNPGNPLFFTDVYPFSISEAIVGDYLCYMGTNTSVGAIGDIFKLTAKSGATQTWTAQNYNIRGPKGDTTNIDDLVPVFRLVENPQEGSSQLQVSYDGINWTVVGNLPSKGIVNVSEIPTYQEGRQIFRIYYTDGTTYDMVILGGALAPEDNNDVVILTPVNNAITIDYTTNHYIRTSVENGDTLTINVNMLEAISGTKKAREIIYRIDNVSTGESSPAVIKVAKTVATGITGKLKNMYDVNATNNTGIQLYDGDSLELVFTFWDKNDVTFNGGEELAVL